MSTSRTFRSPILGRPWFAALAMSIGASAMAFGAYNAENPLTFASKTAHSVSVPVPADVVQTVRAEAAPVALEIPTINLGEMRVEGTVAPRRPPKPSLASTCTPGWRTLEIGPTTQRVEELCAAAEDGPAPPMLMSNPNSPIREHLTLPQTHYGSLGAIEVPAKVDSLSNLLPQTK